MNFFHGKVALVTGGANGIGLAIVKKMLVADIRAIGIIDFSEENLSKAKSSLEPKYGSKILFVKADVSKSDQLKDAFDKIVEKFNNLDIVVNNAGILDEENWEKMVSINLTAVINGTYLALRNYLPKYKSGREGLIINTASILGLNTVPSGPVYCATKHGVIGFAKSLSQQGIFNDSNIRLVTICPGLINTSIFDKFDRETLAEIEEELKPYTKINSTPEYVADSLMKFINNAKHGSVWVTEDNKIPYEIVFPDKLDMQAK